MTAHQENILLWPYQAEFSVCCLNSSRGKHDEHNQWTYQWAEDFFL